MDATRNGVLRGMAALGACLALLGGCAEPPPPPPPPTTAALTVNGSADMNGGAPARVQVYYLTSTSKFEGADYFALADDAQATLGADLAGTDEFLLRPGGKETAAKTFQAMPPSAVGVVAGFRSVDQPGWRAVAPLQANAANEVTVSVGANAVTVESKVAPAAPAE